MVLDELKDSDEVFKINGFTMLIDKQLSEQVQDITVDYVNYGMGSGFKLTSQVPIGGGNSACGSSCSC